MFTGHYAPAFALRRPDLPLWKLFLAAQGVDLLFFALVPLGIERLHLDRSQPGLLALQLDFMPWSHSLVAGLAWGALVWAIGRSRNAALLGGAVATHWWLDLPMHRPDLPLAADAGTKLGWGLWTHPLLAFAFEVGLLALGFTLYVRRYRRGWLLFAALVLVQTLNAFVVPLPPSPLALALSSQLAYLAFTVAAWRVERSPAPSS